MKCDELKSHTAYNRWIDEGWPTPKDDLICGKYYIKAEVDEAIAELNAKLESVQASAYADSVDAGMRERRLQRALYKACANWAICEIDYWRKCLEHVGDYFDVRTGQDLDVKRCEKMIGKWKDAKIKCLKKEEEYR